MDGCASNECGDKMKRIAIITCVCALAVMTFADWRGAFDDSYFAQVAEVAPGPADITNGLVAWFKLDETSGTNVSDSSRNVNSGTAVAASWVAGQIGGAYSFGGTTNLIQFPSTTNYNFGTGNFSISMWLNFPTMRKQKFLGTAWFAGSWNGGYGVEMQSNGKMTIGIMGVDERLSPVAELANRTNQWVMATWVRSSGTVFFYANGVLGGNGSYGSTLLQKTSLSLGSFNEVEGDYIGKMDDVRLYNRDLSSNEVYTIWSIYK